MDSLADVVIVFEAPLLPQTACVRVFFIFVYIRARIRGRGTWLNHDGLVGLF